jgi:hypothetical protein
MIYITDEEIANLPDDPEEAFIELEKIVRNRYESEKIIDNSIVPNRQYMSIILPAAKAYGIANIARWTRPNRDDAERENYRNFFAEVDSCIIELRLRTINKVKQLSVALDIPAKSKLRHLLAQLRETIDGLDISIAKKERLFSRINELQEEIDRDRTRYQVFGALLIEACDDIGEAATRLEPVVRMIERVGHALGIAKRAEETQLKLPPHREPKRIDPPKPEN